MDRASREFERFVDAVYRRLIFYHTVEHLGLGFLAASAVAIVIELFAVWQSIPKQPIFLLCGMLGLMIGIGLAIFRWPTRWSAILETDRQLNFNDLLSSAILSANQIDDGFSLSVRALADTRCRQLAPGDVFLRKLNAQTWGGIATALAIASTLCAMPTGLNKSQAMDANAAALAGGELENGKQVPRTNNATSDLAWNAEAASQINQPGDEKSKPGNGNRSHGKNDGGSGGAGSNDSSSSWNPQKFDRRGAGERSDAGDVAGGGRNGSAGNASNQNDSESQRQTDQASRNVPAWHSDPSSIQPTSGAQILGGNHIPAEDADLVRDFFKPR